MICYPAEPNVSCNNRPHPAETICQTMSYHSSKRGSDSDASRQKLVRYLGAGSRRHGSGNESGDVSVRAETLLTVIAAVLLLLITLGIWQEARHPSAPAAAVEPTTTAG